MTTKSKTNRRQQNPKPAALRTGSPERMAMLLRNGEGAHGNPKAYKRQPKHKGRGYDDE